MSSIVSPFLSQITVGALCGFSIFLVTTTYQKVCLVAGVIFKEIDIEDDIPMSERLDKDFWDYVVIWPIGEELVFRGALQPLLTNGLLLYMPQLTAPMLLGLPAANVISSAAVGTGFGIIHYFAYQSGGKYVALIISVSGIALGLLKVRFGIVAPISAHIVHNYMVGWLDKHYPAFLEAS